MKILSTPEAWRLRRDLLMKQNPMAPFRVAWCPGGLTAQKTFSTLRFITASTPAITPPAASSATS
jgi:hypothetical protein